MARYENVSCSQCGEDFGPGDHGFSSCKSHGVKKDYMTMNDDEWVSRVEAELARTAQPLVKRWPFVESPGEFTDRLVNVLYPNAVDPVLLCAALRTVLIEQPATVSDYYLATLAASRVGITLPVPIKKS